MQVLLWGLPTWMRDVVEHAVGAEPRLWLVPAPAEARDLFDAVERTHPDVVVTGGGDRDVRFRGFAPLLFEFPLLRVYSIGGSGMDTVQVTLLPTEESLGDVSLDMLVSVIAGDRRAEVMQPTRPLRNQ